MGRIGLGARIDEMGSRLSVRLAEHTAAINALVGAVGEVRMGSPMAA